MSEHIQHNQVWRHRERGYHERVCNITEHGAVVHTDILPKMRGPHEWDRAEFLKQFEYTGLSAPDLSEFRRQQERLTKGWDEAMMFDAGRP